MSSLTIRSIFYGLSMLVLTSVSWAASIEDSIEVEVDELPKEKKIEYCTVEYAVTKEGLTKDIELVECSNDLFVESTLKAAKSFRYKPKMVDGEAVEVEGVRNTFKYEPSSE